MGAGAARRRFLIAEKGLKDPEEAGGAATEYAAAVRRSTALGYMWVRMAEVAAQKRVWRPGNDAGFYDAKIVTARFFMARVLPQTVSLNHQIKAGASTLMALPAEAF
jgi:hypothetical protein